MTVFQLVEALSGRGRQFLSRVGPSTLHKAVTSIDYEVGN